MNCGPVEFPPAADSPEAAAGAGVEPSAGWQRMLTSLPIGIYREDRRGRRSFANERWWHLAGFTAAPASEEAWWRTVHPQDRAHLARAWQQTRAGGPVFRGEYRHLRANGTTAWIRGEVAAEHDAEGRIVGTVATATEVTDILHGHAETTRRNAELEARLHTRTRTLLQTTSAVEAIDDAVIGSNFDRKIVSWNKAAEVMFGWTAAEMIGQTTQRLTPDELLAEATAIKDRVRRGERINRFETIRKTKSGEIIEVSLSVFPLRDTGSKITGTCAVVRDLTDLKKAERRLRQLSWRLLRAQDEERRRIARDLHDSTAQTVVALSINLAKLAKPGDYLPAERREELLANSLELAASTMRDLRTTAYLLHPPLLDDRGLRLALEWFVGGFQARSGIEVALEIDPEIERLPEAIELALFRVVQESLSNVHRHSESTVATIWLRRENGACVLQVRDCGRGLPPEATFEEGVGISGMKERLAQFGGTLDISSHSQGTTVTARLPL
jgi:PAS domain S-box-containing protein